MTSANQTPRIITITTPGPQGIQGPPGYASSGSNTYLGDQIITGSILISGSIIPNVGAGELTSSFSLGSPEAAWKDIYVSNGSIKFISSGSTAVTLSAQNGGISVNGGSIISANGVSGQFITSKSLDTNTTVKDYNNSLLLGPIDIETDKEIVVEEGSDLTIFGDIENVVPDNLSIRSLNVDLNTSLNGALAVTNDINASGKIESSFYTNNKIINSDIFINDNDSALIIGETISVEEDKEISIEDDSELTIFGDIETPNLVDNSLFATSASFADTSSYTTSASYSDTSSYTNSASYSDIASYTISASYTDTSSYAVTSSYSDTASYVLNVSCSCPPPFPYTGEAIINGRLIVNNNTPSTLLDTEVGMFYVDSSTSIDWFNRKLQDGSDIKSVDWASRLLTDGTQGYITSVNWGDRTLVNSDSGTAIDYSNSSSLLLTADGSTFDIGKHAMYTANGAGSLTINGGSDFTVSSSQINLNVPAGIYGFTSASSFNPNSTPGISSNTAVAFAQSGSNFYIYVYIGGRWRSASLS